jgi:hypothetical protein
MQFTKSQEISPTCVGEIFCDLVKDLDFVNHEILLAELYFYGIRGVSKDWFWSYVTNKRRKVEVKSPNTTKTFCLSGLH